MSKNLVNNKKKLTEEEPAHGAGASKKQKLTDTKGKKVQDTSSESETEDIIYPTNKGGKAVQKGVAKEAAKKKPVESDSDESEEEAPKKTQQKAPAKKAPVKQDSDSDESEEKAPVKKAPVQTKKPLPKAESDEDSDESEKPAQKKGVVAKPATKAPVKKAAKDSDSDESEPPKPTKTTTTSKAPAKKAAKDSDSDESEEEKAPVKKPAAKNTKMVDESEEEEKPAPKKAGGKGGVVSLDGGDKGVNEVFVGNLPFHADESSVAEFFAQAGSVVGINLLKGYDGRSKGIAFVRFASEDECNAGVELNGADFEGRALKVEKSTPKESRNPAAGGAFGGRQGGNDRGGFNKGGASERDPNSTTVFVGNLSYQADKDAVARFFESCGPVRDVRLATDQEGNLRGFGHVEFESTESVDKAIAKAGQNLDGRAVRVDFSGQRKPREDGDGGRGFGGGRGGFGGGRGGFGGGRGGRGGFGGGRGGYGDDNGARKGSIGTFAGNKVRL